MSGRVLICVEQMCGVSSLDAGTAVARAFAARGAQCAVVPLGLPGAGAATALADTIDADLGPLLVTAEGAAEAAVSGDRAVLSVSPRSGDRPFATGSSVVGDALRALVTAHPDVREVLLDVGSADWHDGGAGLLAALGARADAPLDAGVDALTGISTIDLGPVTRLLRERRITLVATTEDANSPLTGLRGITSRLGTRDRKSVV